MANRWEIEEIHQRVTDFLDGRDITRIPKEDIWGFIGMKETKASFPAQAAMRLVCMYELNRMRNDSSYASSVEVRTLRNLWYDVVKPFLNQVERARDILADKWGRKRSQVLSAVMSEMVLTGMCRYKEFNIEDRSRPKRRPGRWDKLRVGRFDEVVLFIEKDSQFPRIEILADLLGFTVECGKGQQATTAIEGLIDSLQRGTSYLVLTITDHDYYGHLIAKSMAERVTTLGIDAEFHRVGVNPEQVPPEKIDVAKFLLPNKTEREQEWAIRYALEGRYGLEIEALTARELRKALADAVYQHCDPSALYDYLKKKAIDDILDDVIVEVVELLAGEDQEIQDLLEEINELQQKMDDLKDKLKEKVDPVAEKVVDEQADELDNREGFPYDWLEQQIIDPQFINKVKDGAIVKVAYLNHSEYTDPSDMQEGLVQLVKDQLGEQEDGDE